MAVRAKDIAKKLGVSEATVSLVLNNKPGVGDKTREMVMKEIEGMGYESNIKIKPAASSKNIRFILFKSHGLVVGDTPFFSRLIESIEGQARDNGFNIVISYLNRDMLSEDYISQLSQDENMAGIMLLATEMSREDVIAFSEVNLPVLVLDNSFEDMDIDCVQIDNVQGVKNAVRHLVQCGHEEIGYLRSSAEINNFEQRYMGFISSLAECGLEFSPERVICIEPTIEGAYRDMKAYLDSGRKPPKALFADNDILAVGASRALKEAGYSLPQDVSVVGFDDMPYCTMMRPQLTTVRVNNAGMGGVAIRRLSDAISNKADETVKILLRTELIVRKSVKEVMQ